MPACRSVFNFTMNDSTRHAEYLSDLAKLSLDTLKFLIRRAQKIATKQGDCLLRIQESKYPRTSLTFYRESCLARVKTNVRLHLLIAVYNWKKANPKGPSLWPDSYQVSHDCHNRSCIHEEHIHAVPDNPDRSNQNCPGKVVCRSCKAWMLVCTHATLCLRETLATCCSNCKQ